MGRTGPIIECKQCNNDFHPCDLQDGLCSWCRLDDAIKNKLRDTSDRRECSLCEMYMAPYKVSLPMDNLYICQNCAEILSEAEEAGCQITKLI